MSQSARAGAAAIVTSRRDTGRAERTKRNMRPPPNEPRATHGQPATDAPGGRRAEVVPSPGRHSRARWILNVRSARPRYGTGRLDRAARARAALSVPYAVPRG